MLFIHDHTFVKKNEKYYTTGSLNQRVMDRYRGWFGTLSVFATEREATEKDTAFVRDENQVSGIDFNLVPKKNSVSHIIHCSKSIENAVKKADCVVVRMSIFGAIGIHYARKHKIPYFVEMVACPWDSLWYHSLKGKILAPFMTLLTKSVCRKAPYVLYVTNEFLQKRYPSKGITIGCSDVELTNIDGEVLKRRLERIGSGDTKKLKLCTVANIAVRYKGQDIVIKSLKELKEHGILCDYYLIGGGDSQRLESVAKECGVEEQVHILGPKPHEEIFDLLDEMDVYVQPSLQEGLPRAVIEAMSRGCPVVGSTTGGIPELINPELVFKKGSQSQFISVMKKLNQKVMIENAKANFEKSKEFEKTSLDKKRESFYLKFANSLWKGR